jgi:hypothetical protein
MMATLKTAWTAPLVDQYLATNALVDWAFARLRDLCDDGKYQAAVASNAIPQWLLQAEREAAALEMSLVAAGGSIYDEFLKPAPDDRNIRKVVEAPECCVVLLDGLSLREIPELVRLAQETPGCSVKRVTWALSGTPAETMTFRHQRLGMARGITQLAAPMAQLGVTYRAYRSQADILQPVASSDRKVFVWSEFPDNTFSNDSAKSHAHFTTNIVPGLRQVWKNLVMKLGSRKIVITSDHGYILLDRSADAVLGPELWEICPAWHPSGSDQRTFRQRFNQVFGGGRFIDRQLTPQELDEVPDPRIVKQFECDGQVYCAVIGRFFWRAGGTAFDHDGLSLMECILPWVELEMA